MARTKAQVEYGRYPGIQEQTMILGAATGKPQTPVNLGKVQQEGWKVNAFGNGMGVVNMGGMGSVIVTPEGNIASIVDSPQISAGVKKANSWKESVRGLLSNRSVKEYLDQLSNRFFDSKTGDYSKEWGKLYRNTVGESFLDSIKQNEALKKELGFQTIEKAIINADGTISLFGKAGVGGGQPLEEV